MARNPSDFLNVTTPENEIESPRPSAVSASAREEVKQWSRARNRPCPISSRQDCRDIVVGVARMDDEREVELARKRDLPTKDALGDVTRRVVVMIVEASLADADTFGMIGECAHGGEVLRPLSSRLMRMRADREKDVLVPLRDRDDARGLRYAGADGDHALDAGRPRALNDPVEVVGEVGKIEVAMAVDESHSALAQALTSPAPLRRSEERPAPAGAAVRRA